MSVRFYKITWLVFLGIATLTYFAGSLSAIAGVVFGFVVFGLVFMGMMSVLPASITHPAPVISGPRFFGRLNTRYKRYRNRIHESRNAWMSSNSIEVRRPKFH